MSLKGLLGAVAAALMVSWTGSANAQAPINNPTGVVPNYNIEQIESLLAEFGVTYQRRTQENSAQYLLANIDGLNLLIRPQACDTLACAGLEMVAFFNDFTASAQQMNLFNREYKPTRVFLDPQGRTFFSRYLIGDHGYTRGSFYVNLAVFSQSPRVFFDAFPPNATSPNGAPPTANQISMGVAEPVEPNPSKIYKPGEVAPTDDFAEHLNAQQMSSMTKTTNVGVAEATATSPTFENASMAREKPFNFAEWPAEVGNSYKN